MENACGNCRFWKPGLAEDSQFGSCRRYPPEIVDNIVRKEFKEQRHSCLSDAIYNASCFPITFIGEWCGLHEERQ